MSKSLSLACAVVCLGGALLAVPERAVAASWGEPGAAESKIAEKLQAPTELDFLDTPLTDVVKTVGQKHELPIQLDQRALDDVGIPSDVPVTIQLKGVSLASALSLMLDNYDLTYIVDNEVLRITTPEEAESRCLVRVYPIEELLDGSHALTVCHYLIKTITNCIDATAWAEVGGMGDLGVILPRKPTALVVRQEYAVQQKIARLLECLGELPKLPEEGVVLPLYVVPAATRATLRVTEALKDTTDLEFINTPLQDVVDTIGELHDIHVRLDSRALSDVGIPADCPITFRNKGISLRSALRLMLNELDLTYVVAHEVLLITTPEEAETQLATGVYPLRGMRMSRESDDEPSEVELLLKTITKVIAPESWDDVGGPGTVSVVSLRGVDALVVTQTREVHEQLAGLLSRPEFRKPPEEAEGSTASEP